jgi:dihydroceramide fatty acyl 2-hydroxylase
VELLAAFVTGLFVWTFIEYVIHAWLSHTFRTFATPFHNEHHRDPRRVFAVKAWVPLALIWIIALMVWRFTAGVIFFSGILAGFAAYEWLHYRIHFVMPTRPFESWLRTRHLVHHGHASQRGFGVTSSLWDVLFGTELSRSEDSRNFETAARTPPLKGSSNIHALWRFNLARKGDAR